jgi:glycosyltransferase involved in cell wall biosynthesis
MLLSIVIATRHREVVLWESIEKARFVIKNNPNIEIIVVNDGDSDLTIPNSLAHGLIVINNPNHSVAKARNLGVKHSKGKILLFLDDDMWLTQDGLEWILNNADKIEAERAVYNLNWEYPQTLINNLIETKVGRYILTANYHTLWGRMHQSEPPPTSGYKKVAGIGSGSLVLTKKIFDEVNGYNEMLTFQGEDNDLNNKLNTHGVSIYACFDALLFHNHGDRTNLKGYLDREFSGFRSEVNGIKNGALPNTSFNYSYMKYFLLNIFSFFEPFLLFMVNKTPNGFTAINNKLIGLLCAIQKIKAYKHFFDEK